MENQGRYGYERLSKDRSLRGINVDIQREEIDECAEDTGDPIRHHYCDNDISASEFSTKPRDEYLLLLDDIRRGVVSEIIITEVPRLARKTEEAIELITYSKVTALRYIRTTDGMVYDLHTPRGKKSFRDAVSDAEFESDQTSTRQHRKVNKSAERGKPHGGQRRYGYEGAIFNEHGILMNPGRVGIAKIDSEIALLTEAADRIIAGERELDVVRDYNKRGLLTGSGTKWRAGNLMSMLTQKSRIAFGEFPGKGTRVHKGKEYEAIWGAVFSKEQYELLRSAQLRVRTQRNGKGRRPGRSYTYTGLVYCGKCGSLAYGNGRTLASGTYQRRYVCKKTDNYGVQVGCGGTMRSADPLEMLVKEAVLYRFDTPDIANALAPRTDEVELKAVMQKLSSLRVRRQEIVEERALGELSKEDFALARKTLDEAIDTNQEHLNKLHNATAATLLPADGLIREAWERNGHGWRLSVAKLLIKKIIIHPSANVGAKRWNGFIFDPETVEIVWLQ